MTRRESDLTLEEAKTKKKAKKQICYGGEGKRGRGALGCIALASVDGKVM